MKYVLKISGYMRSIPIWIVLSVLLFLCNWLVGFNGLYGQDSFEYLRYSRVIHTYLTGGALPGPFHWPVLYPLAGALVSFVLPDIIALQLISIAFYGLTILFLQKILWYILPEKRIGSSLFILLFFALSPFVLRYSSTVMSDSMAMCFLTAFFYFFYRFTEEKKNKHFLILIFLALTSVNIRFASIVIVIVPVIAAVIQFSKNFSFSTLILSLLMVFAVFLPAIILENKWNPLFYKQIMVPDWSLRYLFQRSFSTENGTLNYPWPNICLILVNLLHPGFIFAGLIFFLKNRINLFKRSPFLIAGIVLILYALFIAGLPTQNYRFLLLTFPLVILIYSDSFFLLFNDISKILKPILFFFFVIAIVVTQLLLTYRAFKPSYRNSVITREIADRMKKFPAKTIYTFNIDMALKAYGVENKTISLWESRISRFEPGSLVLFNYLDSYKQWKGTNPMLNWESLQKEHQLKLIDNMPGNWNLYEIEN